jgi:hypothetical protein
MNDDTHAQRTSTHSYLADLVWQMQQHWPDNRTINIVCHGHSVPAGYSATPFVDTFNAYPHLLHVKLKGRFPFAAINMIVTAIGGENSQAGAERFERDVLAKQPDLVTIDYALNDRVLGLDVATRAWRRMIEAALARGVKVLLLTPTPDIREVLDLAAPGEMITTVAEHAQRVRELAAEYHVGLVDSTLAFERYVGRGGDIGDLMSWVNHPNRAGHELVADELMRWFVITKI